MSRQFAPPEQFEEYRIVRALGRGAMGQVFLAHDTLLDRPVAVKFIANLQPDHPDAASMRERFFIEARAIARLAHPNVVAVHRVGEWHGRPYLVSERVLGKSLDRIAKPLSPASVVQIARGLCRGLSAAHRKGVLHRDIKPANVMLTPTGEVKLLDFGLAKLLDSEPAQSGMFPAMSAINLSPVAASPPQAGGLPLAPVPVDKPAPSGQPPASAPLVETRPAQLVRTPSAPPPSSPALQATHAAFRSQEKRAPSVTPRALRSDPGLSTEEQLAVTAPHLVRKGKEPMPVVPLEEAPTLEARPATAAAANEAEPLVLAGDSSSLTQAGAVIGSPLYMAPELWRGEPATRRSDIYALGTLLYELCAERAPHDGSTLQELPNRVQTVDVPPLIRAAPLVDPQLAAIIDRCLCRNPEERFESAEALLEALEQLPLGVESRQKADGDEPYRGLRSFEPEQRGLFFGRDVDIRALLERLRTEALIAVTGDSGVGKSSLCKAGVLSAVQRGELGPEVRIVSLVPGRYPLAGLSAAMAPVLDREERELLPELLNMPEEVGRQLRRRNRNASQPLRVLLYIDQCEELFTTSEPREVEQLAGALSRLCNYAPDFRVLLSVRSDFLSRLAALPELGSSIGRSLYLVGPLTSDGLRTAIVQPALSFGVRFESTALVDELIRATGDTASGLPLLSFTLAALWQERDRQRGLITQAALLSLGGVTGALARHADGVLARLPPAERQVARRILGQLVSSEGVRVRRQRSELLGAEGTAPALAAASALEALVRGRILVAHTPNEAPDDSAYELAHPVFLSGWATLRGWLARDAELRAIRQRLGQAATDWQRFGRSPTLLWQRPQLVEAEPLDDSGISELERDFLRAGARAVRRQQILRWTAIVALPLTLGLVYGAAQLRSRVELKRQVQEHLAQAQTELAFGRSKNHRAEELREEALAAFDSRNSTSGETLWREVQVVETDARAAYRRASKSAEAAFMLQGTDRAARDTLATTLSERALISERNHYFGNRDELLARLWLFDQDGSYRRRWFAPAVVRLHPSPGDAEGTLVPIDSSDENRRPRFESARALSPGLHQPLELEPGAYLLLLRAPGRAEVRYPLLLRRGMSIDLNIELLPAAAIPAGFVYVPGGISQIGSDADDSLRRDFFYHVPIHPVAIGSFLISQHETTYADWLSFLRALPPAEASRRLPFASGLSGSLSLREDPGTSHSDLKPPKGPIPYLLTLQPTTVAYSASEGVPLQYRGRTTRAAVDWRRLPVSGISADDALAYVRWLDGSGRLPGARLCTELEWERAARGADERLYPHGDQLEPDDANFDRTYGKIPQAMGPDEVGAHPTSRSLFLVDDLVGNVLEWTQSALSGRRYVLRGGAYYYGAKTGRIDNRHEPEETLRNPTVGLRVCATIRGTTSL